MWIDNGVVDYTNWKAGMPKSDTCVDINSDSGQWSTNSCSRYRSYICKTPKGNLNLNYMVIFILLSVTYICTYISVVTPTETPPAVGEFSLYLKYHLHLGQLYMSSLRSKTEYFFFRSTHHQRIFKRLYWHHRGSGACWNCSS